MGRLVVVRLIRRRMERILRCRSEVTSGKGMTPREERTTGDLGTSSYCGARDFKN